MDDGETPEPSSEVRVGAKLAFFGSLDARLAAGGYAVAAPPPPVPPPPAPAPSAARPALSFEAWGELSVRFVGASPEDVTATLSARGLTPEAWRRVESAHRRAISDDLRAGRQELAALYHAKHQEALARGAGEPAPPAVSGEGMPPAMPTPQVAPESLRSTAGLRELPPGLLESVGRMPFVPPPPAAAFKGKTPAKTTPSKAVPTPVGGETMGLGAELPRPTPTLPFVGSGGSGGSGGGQGVIFVPRLDARQYVALCAELTLQPVPRAQTLRRYHVPTEASFRALEEEWQQPGRRGEAEKALGELGVVLRGRVLR